MDNNGLPKGWIRCELGDVAILKNGYAFKSKDYSEEGISLIRISDINDGIVSTENSAKIPIDRVEEGYWVEKGDILIAMSGATTGKFGVYNETEKALQNQRVGNIKPYDENLFVKKFLFYLIADLKREIEKRAYGGAQPNISGKLIEALEIPLPPLPEQHRIVAKIEELFSELDHGVAQMQALLAQLKTYRQAVLKYAFEGKLTEQWRSQQLAPLGSAVELLEKIREERQSRYEAGLAEWKAAKARGEKVKKPGPPKVFPPLTEEEVEGLPVLPEGWVWVKLKTISTVLSGYAFKSKDFVSEGVPVIKIGNIGYSEFHWKDQQFLPKEFISSNSDFLIEHDDLLIALTRPITNNTTKVCRYPDKQRAALLNQRVASIKDIGISKDFLFLFFQTTELKNYIKSKFSETLQPNLSPKDLELTPTPIPSLEEQHAIVLAIETRLSIAEQAEAVLRRELAQAEALRQSILKKAFEGKLVGQEAE